MAGITLKQLSELSGLSIRTVSRVLKGQAHVIPEKRDLILELARKHHYIPNMAARNLRLNRTNIVGIICANMMQEVSVKKLHDLVMQLEACGYYPLIGRLDCNPENIRHMLRRNESRGGDAVGDGGCFNGNRGHSPPVSSDSDLH